MREKMIKRIIVFMIFLSSSLALVMEGFGESPESTVRPLADLPSPKEGPGESPWDGFFTTLSADFVLVTSVQAIDLNDSVWKSPLRTMRFHSGGKLEQTVAIQDQDSIKTVHSTGTWEVIDGRLIQAFLIPTNNTSMTIVRTNLFFQIPGNKIVISELPGADSEKSKKAIAAGLYAQPHRKADQSEVAPKGESLAPQQ
jgi:hypothetical protein